MRRAILLIAVAFAAAGVLLAQAQVGAGDLTGSVADATGNLIRGVFVQLPYVVVFLGIAWWWFNRKDVLS